MVWIVRLVQVGAASEAPFVDVMTINWPDDLDDIANLGLTVADGKRVLAGLQQEIVAAQAKSHSVQPPECRSCSGVCHLKDYRNHVVATHLGRVTVRLPRFRCPGWDAIEGTAAKLGVKRQPRLAGIRRSLDKTSARSRNRACHCRRRNEPEAGGPRRVVTTAFAEICSSDGSPENWPSLR